MMVEEALERGYLLLEFQPWTGDDIERARADPIYQSSNNEMLLRNIARAASTGSAFHTRWLAVLNGDVHGWHHALERLGR